MRLLLIRHGDPDYKNDTLTERGWKEAEVLSQKLVKEELTHIYVSPLGRAKDTASKTLEKLGRTAETLDWLREFSPTIYDPEIGRERICWDWLPGVWTKEEAYYDRDAWCHTPVMEGCGADTEFDRVRRGLDELLERHGYVREENIYRAERPNRDTIAMFCHFGVACIILGHLIGASPMVLWHGLCGLPTSVTTVMTEERRAGIASFRATCYGDVSHLTQAGVEPNFSGRFCETYDNASERHD